MLEEVWPQIGRGGFYRNKHGEVVVSHPDGGKRTMIYKGASSWWPFSAEYRGDPIYGARGTWVHELCDLIDNGDEDWDEDHAVKGINLGIPDDLQIHIATSWIAFRDVHDIGVHAIEQTFVNDKAKCASNCDRIVTIGDSGWAGGDIKTSSGVMKETYAAQLAMIVGSKKYDPETGERTDWEQPIDPGVGYIFWFPLNQAIKATSPDDWPDWTLVRVYLTGVTETCDTLIAIRDADTPTGWFTTVGTCDPVEQWLLNRIERLAAIPAARAMIIDLMDPKYGSLGKGLDLTYEDEMNTILNKIEDVCGVGFPERHPLTPTRGGKKKTK
jgi:hypothetical protein